MKNIFFLLAAFICLPFLTRAQEFTEADIPTVKEIQTNILDLMVKAVSNFDDMRGAEVLKKDDFTMYSATATPGMHASDYYLTYVNKNSKSYYMSWYTDPHAQLLVTTAVMTMYAYGGDKWKAVADADTDPDVHTTSLYCADVKIGTLRVDIKAKAIAFSVGFFSQPGAAAAPAPKPAPAASEGKSMLDYGVFDTHKSAPATSGAHDYKVYCFISTCTQNGKTFKVLSKVTADISKHSLDDMRADALHRISNNGWYIQGNAEYAGLESDLQIEGKAGRDYSVSEVAMYDF